MGHFINVVFTQRCSEGGSQPNQACVMAAVRAYTSSQCPALSPDGICTRRCDHRAVLCPVISPPCCQCSGEAVWSTAAILGVFKVDFKGLKKPPSTSPDHVGLCYLNLYCTQKCSS